MTDDASWLQSLLECRRPDPGRVVGRWALGIGDMVAEHPLIPDKLRGPTRKLNHFGGVAISEAGVEFDADDDMMQDADHRAEQIKSMLAKVQAKVDRLR
jgi:hypothetical protein